MGWHSSMIATMDTLNIKPMVGYFGTSSTILKSSVHAYLETSSI